MSGLEFASTLIGQLISWPVAILVVGLALRKPLTELLPKLRSYEGLGQKISFGDRLAETEESVDQAVGSIEREAGSKQLELHAKQQAKADEFAILVREAETNPSYVILVAWEQLNGAIDGLIEFSLGIEGGRPSHVQVRDLQERQVINKDFARAVNDMLDLRNRVAHGQHNPTSGEAVAYVLSAEVLAKAARVLADLAAGRAGRDRLDKNR